MDAIVNTTPTEAGDARVRGRGTAAAVVLAGLLGCALLALGVPRLIAGMMVADSQDIVWDLARGRPVAPADLEGAIAARAAATRWEPSGERDTERGMLLIRRAEASAPGAERDRLLADAAAAIEEGLSRGPVQPYAWAALAALREQAGDRRGAVDALRLSMLSGAFDPDLMVWRIGMGLRLLPSMTVETQALLRGQVRKAWVMAPDTIARLGDEPEAGAFVRRALDELTDAEVADYVRRHGRK